MLPYYIDSDVFICAASSLAFTALSYHLRKNECIHSNVEPKKRSLWFNTLLSMIHSAIVSVVWTACFYFDPNWWKDLMTTETCNVARTLVFVSLGYFIYDFYDTARELNIANQWPVLAHHVIVIGEFFVVGKVMHYHNFLIMALSCEVNTVYLHLRQLFHLSKTNQTWWVYKLNKHVNLWTYLIFRMVTLVWIIYSAAMYGRHKFLNVWLWSSGVLGTILMAIINIILLKRILKRDFLHYDKRKVA